MGFAGVLHHGAGDIFFESAGSGPCVVLLHGFGFDRRMWAPQVGPLSGECRVVSYDCRGFGRSSRPSEPYNHADDLHALLERLRVSRAHLAGLSMGGRIALAFASRYPERVASLVLFGSDVGGHRFRVGWDVDVAGGDLAAARATWLRHPIFRTAREDPAVWSAVRRMVGGYSGWHWSHEDVREPSDIDTVGRLHDIRAPATVVVGERDLPDFHDIARLLVRRMPNATAVVVPGAGHLVTLEAPDECTRIIRARVRAAAA